MKLPTPPKIPSNSHPQILYNSKIYTREEVWYNVHVGNEPCGKRQIELGVVLAHKPASNNIWKKGGRI